MVVIHHPGIVSVYKEIFVVYTLKQVLELIRQLDDKRFRSIISRLEEKERLILRHKLCKMKYYSMAK